jgi:hypothetical protein
MGSKARARRLAAQRRRRARRIVAYGAAAVALAAALVITLVLINSDGDAPASALPPEDGPDPGLAHVHGLGVDPADGTLYAASHHGLFRVPASGAPVRVANRYQDTMGFTVVGARHFLGSGHPDGRESLPPRLGLIESTDAGETWSSLSLPGEADFHSLETKHGQVYGYESGSGQLMVSADRVNWDRRARQPMADFAVSPAKPDEMLATTQSGLARSTDGGRSFKTIAGTPPLLLVEWPSDKDVFGVDTQGGVHASTDGGATWARRGQLEGKPQALTAAADGSLYAATDAGISFSPDGGRSFAPRYRLSPP